MGDCSHFTFPLTNTCLEMANQSNQLMNNAPVNKIDFCDLSDENFGRIETLMKSLVEGYNNLVALRKNNRDSTATEPLTAHNQVDIAYCEHSQDKAERSASSTTSPLKTKPAIGLVANAVAKLNSPELKTATSSQTNRICTRSQKKTGLSPKKDATTPSRHFTANFPKPGKGYKGNNLSRILQDSSPNFEENIEQDEENVTHDAPPTSQMSAIITDELSIDEPSNVASSTANEDPSLIQDTNQINDGNDAFKFPSKKARITPIIVRDENTPWKTILKLINDAGYRDVKAKLSGANTYNITAADEDMQRGITKLLDEKNICYHSYQLPSDKNLKVVIRGLPADTEVVEIQDELHREGFLATQISQMTRRRNGERTNLPLFLVTLPRTDSSRAIYSTQYLLNLKIRIESYKGRKGPTQCYRCQAFFHAQRNCRHNPRCVKCAGPHLTVECPKPREDKPKCANCQGEHTANWPQCPSYPRTEPKNTFMPLPDIPQTGNNTLNPSRQRIYQDRTVINKTYANATELNRSTTQAITTLDDSKSVLKELTTLVNWLTNSGLLELLQTLKNQNATITTTPVNVPTIINHHNING